MPDDTLKRRAEKFRHEWFNSTAFLFAFFILAAMVLITWNLVNDLGARGMLE